MCDLGWVERVMTVDAEDRQAVNAIEANEGYALLGMGVGHGGQTTLTYGWGAVQHPSHPFVLRGVGNPEPNAIGPDTN